MSISEWPAGEAPREKMLLRGCHALSDAELLAVLLDPEAEAAMGHD